MLREAVDALAVEPAGRYIDATYGRGGHAAAILDRLGEDGRLLALDCDEQAIEFARHRHRDDVRFAAAHARFSSIKSQAAAMKLLPVSGILADLGVSSPQLDDAERGFGFANPGALDMRMNLSAGLTAADWIHSTSESEMAAVFRSLGDERYSRRISRAIVEARTKQPISTTTELADLIAACVPTRERDKHPATRTFLAIRMRVNDELSELVELLSHSVELLKRGGRLVLITFHSVEDRVVKRFMREASIGAPGPEGVPFRSGEFSPALKVIGKPRRPASSEVAKNRRARSAVMRVAERLEDA